MYPLQTRAFGAAFGATVLVLGVVLAQPTVPTRYAPIPPSAVTEKDEPFEYQVGGVTKRATRRVRTVALRDRVAITFVRVKAGTFQMGSPKDEPDREREESQHEVTLTKDYYLGLHTVTRGQFRAFVDDTKYKTDAEIHGKGGHGWDTGANTPKRDPKYTWQNPGFDQTDDHPVVNVSWNDAVAFCDWLSKKAGAPCRLPSEAEWEYACRAGTATRFSFGDDAEELWKYANVEDEEFRTATRKAGGIKGSDGYAFTAPVGKFGPNAWGLHDMHGNVWQWCGDFIGSYELIVDGAKDPVQSIKQTGDSLRVLRGGSWLGSPQHGRAAGRNGGEPAVGRSHWGFRVCFRPS